MKGRRIKRMERLLELSGGSVWVDAWGRPCSVCFIMSMQFRTVSIFMKRGIYEYKPKGKNIGITKRKQGHTDRSSR